MESSSAFFCHYLYSLEDLNMNHAILARNRLMIRVQTEALSSWALSCFHADSRGSGLDRANTFVIS
jgi:hypothetical protein